jgi:hypothetical protein
MDEEKKKELEKRLCSLADFFLEYYKPCENGAVIKGCIENKYPCCNGSQFYDGEDCPHRSTGKCTYSNIRCKVSFCKGAEDEMSKECWQSFKALEDLAVLHAFKRESPWLTKYLII